MMENDEKWWKMMEHDEKWWKMMKNDEKWWKNDEKWWKMMKNDGKMMKNDGNMMKHDENYEIYWNLNCIDDEHSTGLSILRLAMLYIIIYMHFNYGIITFSGTY